MNKLGKNKEDCQDNIFPEIHFKDGTKKTHFDQFHQNICETRKLEVKSQWVIICLYVISLFWQFCRFSTLLHTFFFIFENVIQQSSKNYRYSRNLTLYQAWLHGKIMHLKSTVLKKWSFSGITDQISKEKFSKAKRSKKNLER